MSNAELRLLLIEKIMDAEESTLQNIQSIINKESDWWSQMSEDEKESVRRGLKQAENGEFVEHEVVMKKLDKWR